MSRTYKKYPHRYFRRPRGHRQALVNGVRSKAVPPSSWDDINHDYQCWKPHDIALALHKKGWSNDRIVKHLRFKFKMTLKQAERCVDYSGAWYKCDCPSCTEEKARRRASGFWWWLGEESHR
jgi:hypothetical protein